MRKLVKKLALVLALVLAIGCIAPASAQAAEGVRRSWNFAPGEYKPTLNLTVDQSYTLEALDYEAAMDYSIYDVAYYSYNTDALEVSMETGYAVAKAAAKNVKIKAVVLNKETGNTASFWGFVDIAEKEVVATATPTATVAPTKAPFALVDVAQVAKNEIVLTFNDDAAAVKKADLEIKYSSLSNTARYNCYVKGTPVVDGNQVYVTLYNGLKDEATVYVSYKDGEEVSVKASAGDVAGIRIITTQVAVSDEAIPVKIELLDANGIILDTVDANASEKMPEGAYCEMELIGDVDDDGNEIAYASGCDILFTEMGKEVVAVITYHTGDFDDDGNEIVFEDDEYIASIDTTPIVTKASWSVTTQGVSKSNKASYGAYKLAVGDTGYRLAGKLVLSIPQMDAADKTLTTYTEQKVYDGRTEITSIDLMDLAYESSDPSILLVTSEGNIVPVSEGTADIIVRFADEPDEETGDMIEGEVIGVHSVEVLAERKLTTAYTNVTSGKTLSTGDLAYDSLEIQVTAKDQHGNEIPLNATDENTGEYIWHSKINLVQLTKSDKLTNFEDEEDGAKYVSAVGKKKDNIAKFTIKGFDGEGVTAGTYRFKVEVDGISTAAFTIIFKDVKGSAASYDLAGGTSKDVKVQKKSDMPADIVELKAWAYDSSKVKIKQETITGQIDKDNKTVAAGSFWYDVTLPYGGEAEKAQFIADAINTKAGTIKMDIYEPGKGRDDGEENPVGRKVGDYVFTLYIFKNGSYRIADTATVTIKNGQEGLSATVEKLTIDASYKTIMDTVDVKASGAFEATTTTGSALIEEVIKYSYADTEGYCVSLWDGSKEINRAENASTYEVTAIKGYADKNQKITITTITVEKTYSGGVKKLIDIKVTGATITFSEK